MAEIIGLYELVSHLGDEVRLKYSVAKDLKVGEVITDATSGATGMVVRNNRSTNEVVINPTSTEYFGLGNVISGAEVGSIGVVLLSEVTSLEMYKNSAKDFIQDYTGIVFGSATTENITLTARAGYRYVNLPKGEITSINTVTLNTVVLTEDSNYWVKLATGRIDFGQNFPIPLNPNNLIVNITHGSLTIPSAVKTAAIIFITHFWELRNRNKSTKGAQSISFGGKSVNFGRPVAVTDINGILPEISSLLKKKAKIRVG